VYPFAVFFKQLSHAPTKHLFSIIVGIFMMQFVYGPNWIHSLITAVGTYLIMAIGPAKYQHLIVFVFVMGYMCVTHLYRMYVDYMGFSFDFTGTQMVLTMKLTSIAWNYYDGTVDKDNLEAKQEDKRKAAVYAYRARFAIHKLPNPIEFFGYVYCFTCILAGPAFEYTDYMAGVNVNSIQPPKQEKSTQPRKPPSSVLAALGRLLIGLCWMLFYMKLFPTYATRMVAKQEFIASHGLVYRCLFTSLALLVERSKYYYVWKVAEGASIMGGFGFQGYDSTGEPKGWGGVENIDIFTFETASCVSTLSRSWNKRTQGWLERYTYSRTNNSLVATYFVSALWHGFYPGFFLFFLSLPLMSEVERAVRKKMNPYFLDDNFDARKTLWSQRNSLSAVALAYIFVCTVLTLMHTHYLVEVFIILSLEDSLRVWGSYYYCGHVSLVICWLFFNFALPSIKTANNKTKTA
jgi:hypothetical protein